MIKVPFIYFPNLPRLKLFIWKYCSNDIQDKHTKKSQQKFLSSKQHCMSFVSDTFVINTGWDLIKNNDNIRSRYHNVHQKNHYNCFEPPAFKSRRYWVGGISVNLKIKQILGSHKLKGHAYPKIIEASFSFPKFVTSSKTSIYSSYSFLRYIQFESLVTRLNTPTIFYHSHPKN